MLRRFTLGPEIVLGCHDRPAEVGLPQTIHRHPRGEGVAAVDEPAGEIEPVRLPASGIERGEDRGDAAPDRVSRPQEVSADVDAGLARDFPLGISRCFNNCACLLSKWSRSRIW